MVIPGLAWGAASAVAAARGAEPPAFDPLVPALISGLLAGMLEEFGWSGLAFPTLQARYGFVRAGVAVGCIVAVWHLPFFLTPGDDPVQVVVPGLPADADPGKDHLRLDLQRVGRQHPVDGVVPRLGQRLVRGLGQGPAVADAAALTVMLAFWVVAIGALRKQPVGSRDGCW